MNERDLRRRSRRFKKSRCVDCKHAIFDETWGEYKCGKKKHKVFNPDEYADCKDFEKGAVKTSARGNDEQDFDN